MACPKHVWKELYKSPSNDGSTTRINWCELCGTVDERINYYELSRHYNELHVPQREACQKELTAVVPKTNGLEEMVIIDGEYFGTRRRTK